MKKTILLLLTILFSSLQLLAQKHDYHWMMGTAFGFLNEGVLFNFNESPMNMIWVERNMVMGSTNATMSDAEGNLIFYSNGCEIFNAEHELMENGDSINAGYVYEYQCLTETTGTGLNSYTSPQGMLALPAPGEDSIYYLFHSRLIYLFDPWEVKIDRMLYTKINMNKEDGRGAVIEKNITVVEDTLDDWQLSAVRHANGIDWWILNFRKASDTCYTVLLTQDSIYTFVQEVGWIAPHGGEGGGEACFSPDGTKFVRSNWKDQIYMYDFDRATGMLSNFQQLKVRDTLEWGVSRMYLAISPSSQYLYATYQSTYIYQFDLWAEDIQASKVEVAYYDDSGPWGWWNSFGRMELAADCRIYIITSPGTRYLHVIDSPDEQGTACNVLQSVIQIPTSTANHRTIPYFPNYRLGVTPTYPCDSTIALVDVLSGLGDEELLEEEASSSVFLYPNPVAGGSYLEVSLNGSKLWSEKTYRLYDILGREQLRGTWRGGEVSHRLFVPGHLQSGVYYLMLEWEGKRERVSVVVM